MYDIATGLVLLCHAMLYHVIPHTMSKGRIWKGGGLIGWLVTPLLEKQNIKSLETVVNISWKK